MKDTLLNDILKYIVLPNHIEPKKKTKGFAKEFDEISFLELLVKKFQKKGKERMPKTRISEDTALEEILNITKDNKTREKQIEYSLEIDRDSENESLKDYDVTIKYHEDDQEERIDIEIKPTGKAKKELKEEDYSLSIVREKDQSESKAKGNSIDIEYKGTYKKEHVTINYNIPLLNYEEKQDIDKQDFSNLASNKQVDVFPESQMGGILGFTYLGDNYQALRADMLYSPLGKMVDLHEAIHTPDEHETRVLTEWMMDVKKPVYKS